jgi:hypothetical protein
MEDNFDPEIHGIENDEIARIRAENDIRDYERLRELMEAEDTFEALKKLESHGWEKVLDALGNRPRLILEEMLRIFLQAELYEKCATCRDWLKKVECTIRGVEKLLQEIENSKS